jgi:capsular polysaccharide biosynthesis protein
VEEVSIKELFFILAKRKKVILLITIVSILASGIVSFFILTPEYETFTTLMVGKPKDYGSSDSQLDYNDVLLNQKLVPTYGQLVKSRLVTDEVIKNLELDLTPKEFEEKVDYFIYRCVVYKICLFLF